jgi:glycosyltransferase involved in cell wall biosynthesis
MTHGVPVVASVENGGLNEIISQPAFGFLFDRHDTEVLAAAVVPLIRNPVLAQQTGQAGRERIRALSDPEAITAAHESLWR